MTSKVYTVQYFTNRTTVEWTWWRHQNTCYQANFRDDRGPQVAKTTTAYVCSL